METVESEFITDEVRIVPELAIQNITEPVILRYFETLNTGNFEATSQLFAVDGVMHPPFESEIAGSAAIAAYLQEEAQGMILLPREGILETDETGCSEVQVTGKVRTSWFSVNVSWEFKLNLDREITFVKIKLLASPQELLNLRRS